MSFTTGENQQVDDSVAWAISKGVHCIISTGNDRKDDLLGLINAACPSVLSNLGNSNVVILQDPCQVDLNYSLSIPNIPYWGIASSEEATKDLGQGAKRHLAQHEFHRSQRQCRTPPCVGDAGVVLSFYYNSEWFHQASIFSVRKNSATFTAGPQLKLRGCKLEP